MSAIHKRIYAALKNEFELLAKVFATYLPPIYPYDVVGGERQIKVADFDEKVDILPVADPNIFSQTQRINIAQTEMQLAMSNPQIHNLYEVYRTMYEAIGVKNIDLILPPPQDPQPPLPQPPQSQQQVPSQDDDEELLEYKLPNNYEELTPIDKLSIMINNLYKHSSIYSFTFEFNKDILFKKLRRGPSLSTSIVS
jgi:hypothetical protein